MYTSNLRDSLAKPGEVPDSIIKDTDHQSDILKPRVSKIESAARVKIPDFLEGEAGRRYTAKSQTAPWKSFENLAKRSFTQKARAFFEKKAASPFEESSKDITLEIPNEELKEPKSPEAIVLKTSDCQEKSVELKSPDAIVLKTSDCQEKSVELKSPEALSLTNMHSLQLEHIPSPLSSKSASCMLLNSPSSTKSPARIRAVTMQRSASSGANLNDPNTSRYKKYNPGTSNHSQSHSASEDSKKHQNSQSFSSIRKSKELIGKLHTTALQGNFVSNTNRKHFYSSKSGLPYLKSLRLNTNLIGKSKATDQKPPLQQTFKVWYHALLESQDAKTKLQNNDTIFPSEIKLETIFGKRGESVEGINKLIWAVNCYFSACTSTDWTQLVDNPLPFVQNQLDNQIPIRKVDIIKEDQHVNGLKIEESSSLGLSIISSGKCKCLLDSLIFPLDQASYRFFMPAQEVLDGLIGWYNCEADEEETTGSTMFLKTKKKSIMARSVKVLITWIRNHYWDFYENDRLHASLDNFMNLISNQSYGTHVKIIQAVREQRLTWYTQKYVPLFLPDKQISDHTKAWVNDWEPKDFADNLTDVDFLFFRQIIPDCYLRIMRNPGKTVGGALNLHLKILLDSCIWFRVVVTYTSVYISREDNIKKKTQAIKRFIKIAQICRDIGNFNGMAAIISGLKTAPVLVWTSAWEGNSGKYLDLFKEMNSLLDEKNGHENYWNAVKNIGPPCVPFLIPYFQELISTFESSPLYSDNHEDSSERVINFKKFYHLYSLAADLEEFRLASYEGKLKGTRERNGIMVSHMRNFSKIDNANIAYGTLFSTGSNPSCNEILNSPDAVKAMKRILAVHNI